MPILIDELLKVEIPRVMRSNGFAVSDHPDCRKLVNTVIDHLKSLLVDVQTEVNSRLAIERLSKITARQKSYEMWIYGICFNFVRYYKENLSLGGVGFGGVVPCDLSMLQIDYLGQAAQRTFDHVNRHERRRPHGGRRKSTHISLPLKVHTIPSAR